MSQVDLQVTSQAKSEAAGQKPRVQSCDREGLSAMDENFLVGNYYVPPPPGPPPFRYWPIFVSGELLDPAVLAKVLQLSNPPVLRLATAIGFATTTWQNRTALVPGSVGAIKHGAAFDGLVDAAMELRLRHHMTHFFRLGWTRHCRLDGSDEPFFAKVFVLRRHEIHFEPEGTPYIPPSLGRWV